MMAGCHPGLYYVVVLLLCPSDAVSIGIPRLNPAGADTGVPVTSPILGFWSRALWDGPRHRG